MNAMTPGKPRPARGSAAPAADGGVRLTIDLDDDVPLDQLPDGGIDPSQFGKSAASSGLGHGPGGVRSSSGNNPEAASLSPQGDALPAELPDELPADTQADRPEPGSLAAGATRPARARQAPDPAPASGMPSLPEQTDPDPKLIAERYEGSDTPMSAADPTLGAPRSRTRADAGAEAIGARMPGAGVPPGGQRASFKAQAEGWGKRQAGGVGSRIAGIAVTLSVELGRQQVALGDLMAAAPGQLFALDRLIEEPVGILVNGQLFARGEVVAIGEQFGVRLTELVDPEG